MASQAALGQTALQNNDYNKAIQHYTAALKESQSPLWLIQRSTAYQRLGKHELALADADNAVLAAINRARREQIATAQFRRAVALHGLKRYGDARMCLYWCRKSNEKEKGLGIWQAKVQADYDKAGGETAETNQITVKEIPDKVEEVEEGKSTGSLPSSVPGPTTPATPAAPMQTPKEKIKHDWFQSNTTVTISILAKGIPKDKAEVTIEEGNVEVNFPTGSAGSTYEFTLSPLFSKIDASKSTYVITPNKLELSLQKATPGLKWKSLEGTEPLDSTSTTKKSEQPPTIPAAVLKDDKVPSYPTSSRHGPKNWDAVATSALKAERKPGAKEEDDVDDEEEGDPMGGFFKKLYKNADPDTRRAMIKSYQESNGTALSTNWEEVKKGPVETKPPEGVEAKSWSS
ncbi:SGS domain-containing protein [Xylogone sp. PMI_703]|nr:SGS domain-containing protein [Xylogone sp. PMI_703]